MNQGLRVEDYEEFGPVEFFRGSFIKSWSRVLDLAKERRKVFREDLSVGGS